MFHLSLAVERFEACLFFYRSAFDARVVAIAPGVANVFVFGAQVTLHDRAASPLTPDARREMHFGAVVPVEDWLRIRDRLATGKHDLLRCIAPADAPDGRGKLLLSDPSGNLVEINAEPSRSAPPPVGMSPPAT